MQSTTQKPSSTLEANQAIKTALLQVARLNDMSQDWKRASEQYQKLSEDYPEDPFILEALARVQKKMGWNERWSSTMLKAKQAYQKLGMLRKVEIIESKLSPGAPA